MKEGTVIGGGLALLYSSRCLEGIKLDTLDETIGMEMVKKACEIPARQILKNSGIEDSVIINQLLTNKKDNF